MPSATLESKSRSPSAHSTLAAVAVVISASLAMAATLPGRTHGLGLITTRLLADFPVLDPTSFAHVNLVATLVGSLLCLPCGWLVDRFGTRPVLGAVMLSLAATVLAMSRATDPWILAATITLSRGIGQSMLSVVSITMLGKWFRKDAGTAMGGYALLMTLLMAVGTGLLASRVAALGWRPAWRELAVVLAALTPLAWLLAVPPVGKRVGLDTAEGNENGSLADETVVSATLVAAMSTGCFWVFALSISLFGLVSSGVSLFQQLILQERGLSESVFHAVLVIGLLVGMVANLVGGWLSRRFSMAMLLSIAMTLLAGSLAALPLLRTAWQAYLQAAVSGFAGGFITVLFFAVWGHAFGPGHLGRIQSAAQMMTVLASAAGPLVVAWGREYSGSYLPVLSMLAAVAAALSIASMIVNVPSAERGDWSPSVALPPLQVSEEPSL